MDISEGDLPTEADDLLQDDFVTPRGPKKIVTAGTQNDLLMCVPVYRMDDEEEDAPIHDICKFAKAEDSPAFLQTCQHIGQGSSSPRDADDPETERVQEVGRMELDMIASKDRDTMLQIAFLAETCLSICPDAIDPQRILDLYNRMKQRAVTSSLAVQQSTVKGPACKWLIEDLEGKTFQAPDDTVASDLLGAEPARLPTPTKYLDRCLPSVPWRGVSNERVRVVIFNNGYRLACCPRHHGQRLDGETQPASEPGGDS